MHLDHELAGRLIAQLKKYHQRAFDLVRPAVLPGKLVLNGEVASFHHRQICIEAAKRLCGVSEVLDRLCVAPMAFEAGNLVTPRRPVRTQTDRPLRQGIVL